MSSKRFFGCRLQKRERRPSCPCSVKDKPCKWGGDLLLRLRRFMSRGGSPRVSRWEQFLKVPLSSPDRRDTGSLRSAATIPVLAGAERSIKSVVEILYNLSS